VLGLGLGLGFKVRVVELELHLLNFLDLSVVRCVKLLCRYSEPIDRRRLMYCLKSVLVDLSQTDLMDSRLFTVFSEHIRFMLVPCSRLSWFL